MSNVHIRFIEDFDGSLVDIEYYHHSCAPRDVLGWPAPEAVDYPVFCSDPDCNMQIDEVPLTEYGIQYQQEMKEWKDNI